jgi:predicted MPP superfamily phosphohydrolase
VTGTLTVGVTTEAVAAKYGLARERVLATQVHVARPVDSSGLDWDGGHHPDEGTIMKIFGVSLRWSTKQALKISGYVEALIEARAFTPEMLRSAQDTPDVITIPRPVSDPELRIMHISDLHFGAQHLEKVDHLLRMVRQGKPHLIVATGDIVNTPSPQNFQDAKTFLDQLAAMTDCLLMCPGNHDRHGMIDLSGYMKGFQLARGPYDCKYIKFNDRFQVAAFVFNSTPAQTSGGSLTEELKSNLEQLIQVRGWIDPAQLAKVQTWRDSLLTTRRDEYRSALKIAILHHHPLPTSRSSYLEPFLTLLNSGQVLDVFTDLGIDIVFHGHQHDPLVQSLRRGPGNREMLVLGAGTATKSSTGGAEERRREVSSDTGFFRVNVGDQAIEVQQFAYANAHDLPFKYVPIRRIVQKRGSQRFLRHRVSTKWIIRAPSMDWLAEERYSVLATSADDDVFNYTIGSNTHTEFADLGFSVTRQRDGGPLRPPEFEHSHDSAVDAVGDVMHMFFVKCKLRPALSTSKGSDDVLSFAYRWPNGFADLKAAGTVQSDIVFAHFLDEWTFEVEFQGELEGSDFAIREFLVLPSGETQEQGHIEKVSDKIVRYRKIGVPVGLWFTYRLTRK